MSLFHKRICGKKNPFSTYWGLQPVLWHSPLEHVCILKKL